MPTWQHKPRIFVLIWCVFVFPFTIWDAIFVFLRPHTFPGHKWHSPYFEGVADWATVDRAYSEDAWLKGEGLVAAQEIINLSEAVLCLVYLVVVMRNGGRKGVGGKKGAIAAVLCIVAGTITLSKSVLWFFNRHFSGYEHVLPGHRYGIVYLWGTMNALYILASLYMLVTSSIDVVRGLSLLNEEEKSAPAGRLSRRGVKRE